MTTIEGRMEDAESDHSAMRFCRLRTCHGTEIAFSLQTGRPVHCPPDEIAGDLRPVLLCRSSKWRSFGFLVAEPHGLASGELVGGNLRRVVWGVRVQSHGEKIALVPSTGRYICAVLGTETPYPITLNRTEPSGWETFLCDETRAPSLTPETRAVLQTLDGWLTAEPSGNFILAALNLPGGAGGDGAERAGDLADAIDAYAALLSRDELTWMAGLVLSDPAKVARMAQAFPRSPWATQGFLALHSWLAARDAPRLSARSIGPELDALHDAGITGIPISFPHACLTAGRKLVRPRKPICIVATCRNEGLYLLDWVAHHRALGVDRLFVYSNDNDDSSDGLLQALSSHGFIDWIASSLRPAGNPQAKAYGHALSLIPDILDYEWCLIIDLDEYLVLDRGRFPALRDFTEWHGARPTDAIGLNWLVFGSSRHVRWEDKPVTERFLLRSEGVSPTIKTLFRPRYFFHSQPHFPITDAETRITYRNSDGSEHEYCPYRTETAGSQHPSDAYAWVNHYLVKSAEEYVWKRSRNPGNWDLVKDTTPTYLDASSIQYFVEQHGAEHVIEDDRARRCAPSMPAIRADMLRIPAIAAADRATKATYDGLMRKLRELAIDQLTRAGGYYPTEMARLVAQATAGGGA